MKTAIMGFFAETSLHPGAESEGTIDLPVAREATTGYPVIFGSGLKGALRDRAEQVWEQNDVESVFGKPDGAGGIMVTDARLLLLPVRSLTGHYRLLTCPYLLERFQRDLALAGIPTSLTILSPGKREAFAVKAGQLYLEELSFTAVANEAFIGQIASALSPLILHQAVKDRLAEQLVVLHNDEFKYFAQYGLPVNARNVLDKNKTSQNLWYEETVSADTLFYSLVFSRWQNTELLDSLRGLFANRPYLQIGGNETIGQGWCAVSWYEGVLLK